MEYAKRPRLPPPFVVISYIGNQSRDFKRRNHERIHLKNVSCFLIEFSEDYAFVLDL